MGLGKQSCVISGGAGLDHACSGTLQGPSIILNLCLHDFGPWGSIHSRPYHEGVRLFFFAVQASLLDQSRARNIAELDQNLAPFQIGCLVSLVVSYFTPKKEKKKKKKKTSSKPKPRSISAGGGGAETWWPRIQSCPGHQEEGPWPQLGRRRLGPEGTLWFFQ